MSQTLTYEVFGGKHTQQLEEFQVSGKIFHSTPKTNLESIETQGLLNNCPPIKRITDFNAVFATQPSMDPSTSDLFRWYDDWCVVVIDTSKLPSDMKWYKDFFSENDANCKGQESQHIFTFDSIPAEAIEKIIVF